MKKKICEICFVKWGQNGGKVGAKRVHLGAKTAKRNTNLLAKLSLLRLKTMVA